MILCPVCEHQQAMGLECEVCGKDLSAQAGLAGLAPPPVAVQRVPELEVTVPDRIGEVALERLPELEANRFGQVEVTPESTPDLETSRASPVGDVEVERVQDLAQDRAPDDGVRTVLPTGALTCRYCKHVQPSGAICERCGMRLPVALVAGVTEVPTEEWVRCRACGAKGPAGQRCKECGRMVAS